MNFAIQPAELASETGSKAFLPLAAKSVRVPIISAALLIPCFWQEYLQAGDMASHVYNAWLRSQIENGTLSGLTVHAQWTNTLIDWMLVKLLPFAGASLSEKMVAAVSVLIFFWGEFYLSATINRDLAWQLCPLFAVLAYGLVFRMGLANCYLSIAMCLWIIGLLWMPNARRAVIAIPLVILALLAHPLPVLWATSLIGYVWALRKMRLENRLWPLAAAALMLVIARYELLERVPHRWALAEISIGGLIGIEQVWPFSSKYILVAGGLLALWTFAFAHGIDRKPFWSDTAVQIWLLTVFATAICPTAVQLRGQSNVFSFLPERLSLLNAVLLCVVLARVRLARNFTRASLAVAALYFAFFFIDSCAYTSLERTIATLASALSPGDRLVAEMRDTRSGTAVLLHIADRPCLGKCFSYANYEPATAQFQLRAVARNRVVASDMETVRELETGTHVVTAAEAPIYSICQASGSQLFVLRRLDAGQTTCLTFLAVAPAFW